MRLLFLLFCAAAVACSPRPGEPAPTTPTATTSVTLTPTATPSSTVKPSATSAATPTPTRAPSPTPTVAPHIRFEVDESVPAKERGLISIGIRLADEFATEKFGGAVENSTVVVQVATEGVCIGGASAIGYQICVNAASPAWLALEPDYLKVKIAAHEYFHVWQHDLFCYRQPKWLFEGLAEWFGYQVIVDAGLLEPAVASADRQQTLQADPILEPLSDQERLYAAPQPNQYALWSFAAERLMVAHEPDEIRAFCSLNSDGVPWQAAFERAFGEPVEDFYSEFEEWRAGFLPYTVP